MATRRRITRHVTTRGIRQNYAVRPSFRAVRARGVGGQMLAFTSLLATAVIWGSSYPFTKIIFGQMTAWQFLALRFSVAAVLMLAVFWRSVRALTAREWLHGALLGLLFGSAQIMQTVGLAHTAATISGFITGLYVVLTPLCAWVLVKAHIGARVWIGAVIAVIGLGVLALQGVSLGLGEWLTLTAALIYALHILGLGSWSTSRNALGLTVVQIGTIAVLCDITAVPGGFAVPQSLSMWLIFGYLAIISGAVAMFVQTWAQSQMSPSRAAVVMATEPVWASLLAITMIGEPLTWRVVIGGTLMLAAMFVVEAGPRAPDEPVGQEDLPKMAG